MQTYMYICFNYSFSMNGSDLTILILLESHSLLYSLNIYILTQHYREAIEHY